MQSAVVAAASRARAVVDRPLRIASVECNNLSEWFRFFHLELASVCVIGLSKSIWHQPSRPCFPLIRKGEGLIYSGG